MGDLVDFWARLVAVATALSALLSLAALAVSIIALRRSGPRVTVTLSTSILIGEVDSKWHDQSAAIIDVSNDGARAVMLQSVELHSRAGSIRGETVGDSSPPYTLEAHGGRMRWLVLRDDLRRVARRDGGDKQVEFRAVARSGRRSFRSRMSEAVHPHEPEQLATRREGPREYARRRIANWLTPSIQATFVTNLADIDLSNGRTVVTIRNFGGGLSRRATLELLEEVNGEHRRVLEPIPIPNLWRGRSARISVPLVERDGLTWWIRRKGHIQTGSGAMTQAQASDLLRAHCEIQNND